MIDPAPGAYRAPGDRWGAFETLAAALPEEALVLADAAVVRLHPPVAALVDRARVGLALVAGEPAKSLATLQTVLAAARALPRGAPVVAVGGGSLGDLAAVVAHLHRRGTPLIQVPSTLLAAVDSSLGGKGALNLDPGDGRPLKNALGVFHYPEACWLCPELFATLSRDQVREGALEAWKMAAALDATLWARWRSEPPATAELIREGRRLKAAVCAEDPYETRGPRRVLNFGHTLGHVLETGSGLTLSHGDAVGLGMLCALDLGRALGVTPAAVAAEVEAGLEEGPGALGRRVLAEALAPLDDPEVRRLLGADKKAQREGEVRMVLLSALGRAEVRAIPPAALDAALATWRAGRRP